jgi:ubiquinone/menaquinone biosynthesis C-methylase UbiE
MVYSIENAQKFNWSSISGNLLSERVAHLEKYLVGQKILDAGCGGGAYVEFLSQREYEVTGIDKYDEFLQVAREKGRLGTYIQADILNIPFPDKSFDCTFCFDVLEHVDDQAAIQELARVTKKRIIMAVPQKDEVMENFGLTFRPYQDPTHLRYYTPETIKALAQSVNGSVIEVITEGIIPFHALFNEMRDRGSSKISVQTLRSAYKLGSSNSFLDRALKKFTSLIIERLINCDLLERVITENPNFYKRINIGLAAIIDL